MKIAYIAHQISGNIEENLNIIAQIAREINLKEPETVPFVPYFLDCIMLDDDNPDERARGIKNDHAILGSGMVNELRLYGPTISKGMIEEIVLAKKHGIIIVPMTSATKREYFEMTLTPRK